MFGKHMNEEHLPWLEGRSVMVTVKSGVVSQCLQL